MIDDKIFFFLAMEYVIIIIICLNSCHHLFIDIILIDIRVIIIQPACCVCTAHWLRCACKLWQLTVSTWWCKERWGGKRWFLCGNFFLLYGSMCMRNYQTRIFIVQRIRLFFFLLPIISCPWPCHRYIFLFFFIHFIAMIHLLDRTLLFNIFSSSLSSFDLVLNLLNFVFEHCFFHFWVSTSLCFTSKFIFLYLWIWCLWAIGS